MEFVGWTIMKNATKNYHSLPVSTSPHSNIIICCLISFKFHIWITFIKLFPRLTMGFDWALITKMTTAFQFAFVDTLKRSFITLFLLNCYMDCFSSNYCSSLLMTNNQDDHLLSVNTCWHSNMVISTNT